MKTRRYVVATWSSICLSQAATILIAKAHLASGDVQKAAEEVAPVTLDHQHPPSGYRLVSVLTGLDTKAGALEFQGKHREAFDIHDQIADLLKKTPEKNIQLRSISESSLYRSVILHHKEKDVAGSLQACRAYISAQSSWPAGFRVQNRATVYKMFMDLLQQNPEQSATANGLGRKDSRAASFQDELIDTQSQLEKLAFSKTDFPRAGDLNQPVLDTVELMMSTWRQNGSQKSEAAGLIDALYRATTKTFQSQRILRHLVNTLYVLGDYVEADLAASTYLITVDKSKETNSKAQKMMDEAHDESTENGNGTAADLKNAPNKHFVQDMDTVEDVVDTLVIASNTSAKWLQKGKEALAYATSALSHAAKTSAEHDVHLMSRVYRALGSAHSLIGYQIMDPATRPKHQKEALAAYKKAVELDPTSVEAHYQLAYQHAEMRNVAAAVQAVRAGIDLDPGHAPSWHLLVLLITAQKDYEAALKLCDVALDEVDTEDEMAAPNGDASSSSNINLSSASTRGETGETVLKLRMTRALLVEALHGPEEALQTQQALFALFSQVFGDSVAVTQTSTTIMPPSRAPSMPSSLSQPSSHGSEVGGLGVPAKSMTVHSQDHFGPGNLDVPSAASLQRKPSASIFKRSSTPEPRDVVVHPSAIKGSNDIPNSRRLSMAPSVAGTVNTFAPIPAPSNPTSLGSSTRAGHAQPLGDSLRRVRALKALVDLWLLSAATFRRWGKMEEAKQAIREAEIVDGTNSSVWTALGVYLLAEKEDTEKNGSDALQAFHKAISLDARHIPSSVLLAKAYLDLDAPGKNYLALAEGLLESITKGNGWDSSLAWLELGRVCERTNRDERARQCYWYAVELEETQGIQDFDVCPRVL